MTRKSNEQRLGLPSTGAKESSEAPPAVFDRNESSQNTFAYVAPTELVDLPSGGKFYPEGHPLYGKSDLEIREMTAKEEDILTSKSLIKKGVVFDRLLKSLMVDKSIPVDDLLVGDKNAILLAARISGYGSEYATNITCPVCNVTDKYTFHLDRCPVKNVVDLSTTEDEDLKEGVSEIGEGSYLVVLPRSKVSVGVRLLDGKDERKIIATQEMRKKQKLPETPLTEHLKSFIYSIDECVEGLEIAKFISSMPASDSKYLRRVFSKLTPNVEMTQEFVCDNCMYEQDLEVPFSADFFWPDN